MQPSVDQVNVARPASGTTAVRTKPTLLTGLSTFGDLETLLCPQDDATGNEEHIIAAPFKFTDATIATPPAEVMQTKHAESAVDWTMFSFAPCTYTTERKPVSTMIRPDSV